MAKGLLGTPVKPCFSPVVASPAMGVKSTSTKSQRRRLESDLVFGLDYRRHPVTAGSSGCCEMAL